MSENHNNTINYCYNMGEVTNKLGEAATTNYMSRNRSCEPGRTNKPRSVQILKNNPHFHTYVRNGES